MYYYNCLLASWCVSEKNHPTAACIINRNSSLQLCRSYLQPATVDVFVAPSYLLAPSRVSAGMCVQAPYVLYTVSSTLFVTPPPFISSIYSGLLGFPSPLSLFHVIFAPLPCRPSTFFSRLSLKHFLNISLLHPVKSLAPFCLFSSFPSFSSSHLFFLPEVSSLSLNKWCKNQACARFAINTERLGIAVQKLGVWCTVCIEEHPVHSRKLDILQVISQSKVGVLTAFIQRMMDCSNEETICFFFVCILEAQLIKLSKITCWPIQSLVSRADVSSEDELMPHSS